MTPIAIIGLIEGAATLIGQLVRFAEGLAAKGEISEGELAAVKAAAARSDAAWDQAVARAKGDSS